MTIDIKEMSEKDLKQKIENIKAEREKTADALKRYEEELERRKKEVPLGVPQDGKFFVHSDYDVGERFGLFSREYVKYNCFPSKESAEKHAEMLLSWRKSLVEISKGEQIDIEVLLPLMKKGYVAMDADGTWCWFNAKPELYSNEGIWTFQARSNSILTVITFFNIKPAEDWTKSLQECGL